MSSHQAISPLLLLVAIDELPCLKVLLPKLLLLGTARQDMIDPFLLSLLLHLLILPDLLQPFVLILIFINPVSHWPHLTLLHLLTLCQFQVLRHITCP